MGGLTELENSGDIRELLGLIVGKITAEGSLGEWKANVDINFQNITKLLTELPPENYD